MASEEKSKCPECEEEVCKCKEAKKEVNEEGQEVAKTAKPKIIVNFGKPREERKNKLDMEKLKPAGGWPTQKPSKAIGVTK